MPKISNLQLVKTESAHVDQAGQVPIVFGTPNPGGAKPPLSERVSSWIQNPKRTGAQHSPELRARLSMNGSNSMAQLTRTFVSGAVAAKGPPPAKVAAGLLAAGSSWLIGNQKNTNTLSPFGWVDINLNGLEGYLPGPDNRKPKKLVTPDGRYDETIQLPKAMPNKSAVLGSTPTKPSDQVAVPSGSEGRVQIKWGAEDNILLIEDPAQKNNNLLDFDAVSSIKNGGGREVFDAALRNGRATKFKLTQDGHVSIVVKLKGGLDESHIQGQYREGLLTANESKRHPEPVDFGRAEKLILGWDAQEINSYLHLLGKLHENGKFVHEMQISIPLNLNLGMNTPFTEWKVNQYIDGIRQASGTGVAATTKLDAAIHVTKHDRLPQDLLNQIPLIGTFDGFAKQAGGRTKVQVVGENMVFTFEFANKKKLEEIREIYRSMRS